MIGLTIMEISKEEMQAIVQHYLNSNLLNTTFQKHHESVVKSVRERDSGRFVIQFEPAKGTGAKPAPSDELR